MKIQIKDIKKHQVVYDHYHRYKAYDDAKQSESGYWYVEVADDGDYGYDLIEGQDNVWDNENLI